MNYLLAILINTDRDSFQGFVATTTTKNSCYFSSCGETCVASQNEGSRVFYYLEIILRYVFAKCSHFISIIIDERHLKEIFYKK